MLHRFLNYIERRRAQRFLESIHAWHQTSTVTVKLCEEALYDEEVIYTDIGVMLDRADKNLFTLRNYASEARSSLKRLNPALARRLSEASKGVFHLRNETARFLIRSQGPGPLLDQSMDDQARRIYYYRAMEEVGFNARQLQEALDKELQSIWRDLQSLIAQERRKIL